MFHTNGHSRMRMLGAMGLGAALMYFLDARGGKRRRALVRDKAIKAQRKTREAAHGRAVDMRNRMKGTAHELGLINGPERQAQYQTTPPT